MRDLEMINNIIEWGFDIKEGYKIYHEDAIQLISFNDYLGDEFEKYLKDNDIELENWQLSDVEEFFEQYGIELF